VRQPWSRKGWIRRVASAFSVAGVLVGATLTAPRPVLATSTTCSFDAGTHTDTVTSTDDNIYIGRSGSDLNIGAGACGTVTTVDTVNIDLGGMQGASIVWDLQDGPLGPGYTGSQHGNPAAYIFFNVTGMADRDGFTIWGGDGRNAFKVGDRFAHPSLERVTGIDLNGFADASSPGDDIVLHGRASYIALNGGGGNDLLSGAGSGVPGSGPTTTRLQLNDGPGADSVMGGSGADTIYPWEGPHPGDVYAGGDGTDLITYDGWFQHGVSVSLDGKANDGANCPATCENDNVLPDIERISGTRKDDILRGDGADNVIDGGIGGTDILAGGAGDDVLYAGPGKDAFEGGPGNDWASFGSEDRPVTVTLDGVANDGPAGEHDNVEPDVENVAGGNGADHLTGDSDANILDGGPGDDVLNGGGGDDTLLPGRGTDEVAGGPGMDTVDYETANVPISVNLFTGTATGEGPDTLKGIENVTGSRFSDHIIGSDGPNLLVGGVGNDTLQGRRGDDVLQGGAGNDTLDGGADDDTCTQGPGTGPVANCEH
jgi:Ca2+-binding RTX toxin-like protein